MATRPTRSTPLGEQETVIRWDREGDMVHVWTANPAITRKLARLGVAPHRPGGFYRVPVSRFRCGLKSEAKAALGRARGGPAVPPSPPTA